MTKTSYINLPSGYEEQFLRGLKSGDRFLYSKIVRNDTLLSKRRKAGISAKSLLPQLSTMWSAFSDAERLAWKNAGAYSNINGWQQFVQDQCIRIVNDIDGVATPSIYHQSWVGKIVLENPADTIKLVQIHPSSYYIIHKVYGKKGMYVPLKVDEPFGLPLTIGLSYQSNLVALSGNASAKFYAKIWNSYQGRDDEHRLEIDLNLIHDWQIATATLNSLRGIIIGYALYIEIVDCYGSLWVDNIKSIHNAVNWARDPKMIHMATTFTRAFQQIPKHWAAEVLPEGAQYDTVYEDF